MYISRTNGPIATKFYLKYHCCAGNAVLGFLARSDWTPVTMPADSSHRVIMGETTSPRFLAVFIGSFSYLQVTMAYIKLE